MIINRHIEEVYKKVFGICSSDGFVIEIAGKVYKKNEITYDYLVDNAGNIGYIEDRNQPESRMYASLLVMIVICLCLDRRYTDENGIQFVGVHDSVLNLIYKVLTWDLNSGYNSALTAKLSLIDCVRTQTLSAEVFDIEEWPSATPFLKSSNSPYLEH